MSKSRLIRNILVLVASYGLAAWMMLYAVSKLLNWQFQVAAYNYTLPLSRVSGTLLTWAFYGYQPWLQRVLGFAEFVPSVLLLFRRTRTLGALLFLPVVLNVVLTNFALDLWPVTKVISVVMLAADICLVVADLRCYAAALRPLLNPVEVVISSAWRRIELVVAGVIVAGVVLFTYFVTHSMQDPVRDFVGVRQINGAGSWAVESIRVSGRPLLAPNQSARLYFDFRHKVFFTVNETEPCVPARKRKDANPQLDIYGDFLDHCGYGVEDASRQEFGAQGHFVADNRKQTFKIMDLQLAGDKDPIQGSYTLNSDQLRLHGVRSGQLVEIVLRRLHWGPML